MTIAENVAAVRARVDAAARAAGRDAGSITLVGASKTATVAACAEAVGAGCVHLGENRAQELLAKAPQLARMFPAPAAPGPAPAGRVEWHFIGRLQRNKVRGLAPWVRVWESVDRPAVADEIARRAPGARVLLEVSIAGEPTKGGCPIDALDGLVDHVQGSGLDLRGLMAVPPLGEDPRPHFARLAALTDRFGLEECSMGMTDDFELAIAEGATTVRVGRAIFGDRP